MGLMPTSRSPNSKINNAKQTMYMDWLQTCQNTSQIGQIVAAKRKENDTYLSPRNLSESHYLVSITSDQNLHSKKEIRWLCPSNLTRGIQQRRRCTVFIQAPMVTKTIAPHSSQSSCEQAETKTKNWRQSRPDLIGFIKNRLVR
jgi:hypothetical protein